ncbi:MAG: NUDIX hydrolase [Actinomycetota bacterium]
MTWQTRSNRTVYENAWIDVSHREVTAPTGHDGIYGLVHFKNLALGVIPIDDEDHTWLVGQDRYTLDGWSWEIPEGGGALEGDPIDAARRELAEETGLRADRLDLLVELHTSNSVTDERALIYVATGLTRGAPDPDETEQLTVRRVPVDDAIDEVLRGEITDAMSVAALLKLAVQRRRDGGVGTVSRSSSS